MSFFLSLFGAANRGAATSAAGSGAAAHRVRGRTPIGLDVGSRRVKAIQLERRGDGFAIAAAAIAPRAGAGATGAVLTAQEAAGLSALLDRAGFEGRRLVLAAPSAWVVQSVLELPPRNGQVPVEQIARVELARAQRCDPDSFEMGCWDLPSPHRSGVGAKGTHLMAVGLPHAQANSLIDPFEAAGLVVEALDLTPCALARACAMGGSGGPRAGRGGAAGAAPNSPAAPDNAVTAILDVGWDAAVLSLLYRGAVVYGRTLSDSGQGELHTFISRRLGLDADVADYLLSEVGLRSADSRAGDGRAGDDAAGGPGADELPDDARGLLASHADGIARELKVSFSYTAHQYPDATIGKLLMVGGGAAIPGLSDHLSAALGVPVSAVAPSVLASCDPALLGLCSSPVLTAALGLALFQETQREMQNAE